MRISLTYLLCFIIVWLSHAQKVSLEFYSTADGLEQGLPSNVIQDAQGFIWIVSGGKLQRFDGTTFVTYPMPDTDDILRNYIGSFQDSLIFVFHRSAAFLYHPVQNTWQRFSPPETDGETHELLFFEHPISTTINITSRLKNREDGRIFSWRFDSTGFHQQFALDGITDFSWMHLYSKAVDEDGNFYVARQGIITKIDRTGRQLKTLDIGSEGNRSFQYNDVAFSPTGQLIYSLKNKLYITDTDLSTPRLHPIYRFLENSDIILSHFRIESNGDIWVYGQLRSLGFYDSQADKFYNYSPQLKKRIGNRDWLLSAFKDRTGTLWINTHLGIVKVSRQAYPFKNYFSGLSSKNDRFSFRGLTEADDGKIYGSSYQDIIAIDPSTNQEQILDIEAKFRFISFDLKAVDNHLFNSRGLMVDLTKSPLVASSPRDGFYIVNETSILIEDEQQKTWWAFPNQLFCLQQNGTDFKWEKVADLPISPSGEVGAFHFGQSSKLLWLGSLNRLFSYNRTEKTFEEYNKKDWQLPIQRIMTIEEDKDGKLWLATDIGLIQFDTETKQSKHYTVNDGLPNNYVCSLLSEGDSCLWMGTNRGLSRFHIETESFTNFFEEDGLTHNEFNRMAYLKARDGQMFFGGLRGVNAFYPNEIMQAYSQKNSQAKVVLSAFEHIDERRDSLIREFTFEDAPTINLYHWDRSFSFEYALTDYSNPEAINYSYKMEGYEDLWSEASPFNFTRFSSLPSGEYTFRVRARDSHGLWHPNELKAIIIVHPPWWQSNWAYLVYVLLLLAGIYSVFSFLKKRWLLQSELQLKQAEAQRLQELDTFKTQLYTNITHEFRTPLTVILGMAEQIRSKPERYLNTGLNAIENNGRSLQRLINQLLDLSKLEDKSFQLKLEQGNIIPYLRYVTESFQTYANTQNLSLQFFSNANTVTMDYDPEQIKQIINNLISNAIKFTPSGGSIEVEVHQIASKLDICVKDTGIGISEEQQQHIFDRFYQVDNSMTREGEGTGIGLAHTRALVQLMQGKISLNSQLGQGTTFKISLPIKTNEALKGSTPSSYPSMVKPVVASLDASSGNSVKQKDKLPQLLIVEDNPDVVLYLKACLSDDYQISVAYNGRIGIEKAIELVPDLIISDVMMPEKNGYEVCRALKTDERTSHIPITLLTAKADISSKIEGLRTGADAYLAKPFNKEELEVRLQLMLEKQRKLSVYFSNKNQQQTENAPIELQREQLEIEDAFIKKVRQIVEAHYMDSEFGLPQLCQKVGMSRSQLYRKMKALIKVSPSEYIRNYRLEQARRLLNNPALNVSEVAWQTGFSNLTHFGKLFKEAFGVLPSDCKS